MDKPLPSSKISSACFAPPLALSGLWDRCNELCAAAAFDNLLCGLAAGVKFPIPTGVVVWRVEDGVFEELVIHIPSFPDRCDDKDSHVELSYRSSSFIILRGVFTHPAFSHRHHHLLPTDRLHPS